MEIAAPSKSLSAFSKRSKFSSLALDRSSSSWMRIRCLSSVAAFSVKVIAAMFRSGMLLGDDTNEIILLTNE